MFHQVFKVFLLDHDKQQEVLCWNHSWCVFFFFFLHPAERVRQEKLNIVCVPTSFQVGFSLPSWPVWLLITGSSWCLSAKYAGFESSSFPLKTLFKHNISNKGLCPFFKKKEKKRKKMHNLKTESQLSSALSLSCRCFWASHPLSPVALSQARQLILQHGLTLSDLDRHPEVWWALYKLNWKWRNCLPLELKRCGNAAKKKQTQKAKPRLF